MAFSLKRLSKREMDEAAIVHRIAFDDRLPWLAGLHTPEGDRAYFRDHVFSACEVWGAMDEALIGFIAFREEWIDQLYVLPRRQRQGVGRELLPIAKAASPRLFLWTFQRNAPARRFYETHGFVAIRETDGRGNEEREPDVLYRWDRGEPAVPAFT
jgi:putative acetyltransferase